MRVRIFKSRSAARHPHGDWLAFGLREGADPVHIARAFSREEALLDTEHYLKEDSSHGATQETLRSE